MSASNTISSSARTTRTFIASCVVYLAAHTLGADWKRVPTASELAEVDAKGQITLSSPELREWYLNAEQREAFSTDEVQHRNRKLASLEGRVREQLQKYGDATGQSNEQLVAQLNADLDQGRYAEALEEWHEIEDATSPKTLASFGRSSTERTARELAELGELQLSQRLAASTLAAPGKPGFLWTSPTGAPVEVLAIASLAAFGALLTRRRTLRARYRDPLRTGAVSALRHAIGPVLALVAWSLVRPNIEFTEVPLTLVSLALGLGFATPYAGRLAARLLGKDLEQSIKRSQSSQRKTRILRAMKDLRPSSFAELKQAASQFAAEITAAEVEEHPQS